MELNRLRIIGTYTHTHTPQHLYYTDWMCVCVCAFILFSMFIYGIVWQCTLGTYHWINANNNHKVCMCVCVFIYTYKCIYRCVYIFIYTHTHTRIYISVYSTEASETTLLCCWLHENKFLWSPEPNRPFGLASRYVYAGIWSLYTFVSVNLEKKGRQRRDTRILLYKKIIIISYIYI